MLSEAQLAHLEHIVHSISAELHIEEVTLDPVLVVDGATVLAGRQQLAGARVSARVVGQAKGPKVKGFTYKPKTRSRRSWVTRTTGGELPW